MINCPLSAHKGKLLLLRIAFDEIFITCTGLMRLRKLRNCYLISRTRFDFTAKDIEDVRVTLLSLNWLTNTDCFCLFEVRLPSGKIRSTSICARNLGFLRVMYRLFAVWIIVQSEWVRVSIVPYYVAIWIVNFVYNSFHQLMDSRFHTYFSLPTCESFG